MRTLVFSNWNDYGKAFRMIVCSCNRLEDGDIKRSYGFALRARQGERPTPGAIFRELGCRPNCGGCFPLIVKIIREMEEAEEAAGAANGHRLTEGDAVR